MECCLDHWDSREARAAMRRALSLMLEALDTIDGFDGSPTTAAHLDLAIASLRDALGAKSSEPPDTKAG
jgi:hypothetical protein